MKVLVTNFLAKVAQISGDSLGLFENINIKVNTPAASIGDTFGLTLAIFNSIVWSH